MNIPHPVNLPGNLPVNLIEQPFNLNFSSINNVVPKKDHAQGRSVLEILSALTTHVQNLRATDSAFAIVTFLPKQAPMVGLLGALDWSLGAPISKLIERHFVGQHGNDETLHSEDPLLFPFKLNSSDTQYVRLLVFTNPSLEKVRSTLKNLNISDAILSTENLAELSNTPRNANQIQKLIQVKCHWLENSVTNTSSAATILDGVVK